VFDVRAKSGTELSTDQHVVTYSLRLKKPTELTRMCRTKRSYQIKWEALVDKGEWRSSQTAYFPCCKSFRNEQRTLRSGGCSKQLSF